MNNISKLIVCGEISIEDLANAKEIIERAELVTKGIAACKKTIAFPLGELSVNCYSFMDSAGEYQSWGFCSTDGTFTCYCNWGGEHVIGRCNLLNFNEVFMAFEDNEFKADLRRFLLQQIAKVANK